MDVDDVEVGCGNSPLANFLLLDWLCAGVCWWVLVGSGGSGVLWCLPVGAVEC